MVSLTEREQPEAYKIMKLAQAHVGRKWWSQNLNLGLFDFMDYASDSYTASLITQSSDIYFEMYLCSLFERQRQADINSPSTGSFLKDPQQPGLGETKARS